MNYSKYPLFILLLSLSSQAHDIPVVAAKAAPAEKGAVNDQPPLADTLIMQPGINQIVPVSIYHLNRIITPFNDPAVTNSSAVVPEIRQNVLYISPQQEAPITLFITERGEESTALSLTLLPQRIPPREITLTLPSVKHQSALRRQTAKPWEQSQPYVLTLRNLLRQLVLGEVPPGYNLVEQRMDKPPVLCQQPGLAFDFSQGQQLLGHHLQVQVGVVTNRTSKPIEFRESSCAGYGVTAVAAWPKTALLAGDRSEVYVVQRQQPLQVPVTKRPSLLGDKS